MENYKFTISERGCNMKQSNTWLNAIKYASKMAKDTGKVITVKSNNAHVCESFKWSEIDNKIIPSI